MASVILASTTFGFTVSESIGPEGMRFGSILLLHQQLLQPAWQGVDNAQQL
ncbi:hypothetical protein ACJX0J_017580, partial [Zea mays]